MLYIWKGNIARKCVLYITEELYTISSYVPNFHDGAVEVDKRSISRVTRMKVPDTFDTCTLNTCRFVTREDGETGSADGKDGRERGARPSRRILNSETLGE